MRNLVLVIIILAVAGLAYYLGQRSSEPADSTAAVEPVTANSSAINAAPAPEPVKYPVNRTVSVATQASGNPIAPPLPELDQSDESIRQALAGLYSPLQLNNLFIFESVVRHFVVTVDNMTSAKLPQKYRVNRLPADKFLVKKDASGEIYIDAANYTRYTAYVELLEAIDLNRLVDLYFNFYPLFQRAYEELGYPDRYFNDRLVEVVDHLLAAPDVRDPVKLLQPVVYYTFADPDLEQLSAGQKLMLRIGHDNAARVKSWLRRLRSELTNMHRASEQ